MSSAPLFPRSTVRLLEEALEDTRVVLVNGARQSGKSTLTTALARKTGGEIHVLDNPTTLTAAQGDPVGFCEHDGLLLIDEVQLAPELIRAIKLIVDADQTPGQFLLTGSSQVLAMADVPDGLPGRMEIIELWPLSQAEIERRPVSFVDWLFDDGQELADLATTENKRSYLDRVVRRSERRRAASSESYLSALVSRDVLAISAIERYGELRRLLRCLADRSGDLLVTSNLADEIGIPRTTVQRYLGLLQSVFVIKILPAWSPGGKARTIGTPKVVFVDSGLLCHLLGQDANRLAAVDGMSGKAIESFVLSELARHRTWADTRTELFHFRTKDKKEVDAVLESADGRIVGVEVKAGATIRSDDLGGMRQLARLAGARFVGGIVLYTGSQVLSLGGKIRAVPIDALWRTPTL